MILRIDGHEIPVADLADLTEDELAEHQKAYTAEPDESGHFEVKLPYSSAPGKATLIHAQHGGDATGGATFSIVRPPGDDPHLHLASLRPVWMEGRNHTWADRKHQRRLFHAVGAVAVAGGHVEMALRKVLVTMTGGQNTKLASKDIPTEWKALEDKIRKLCKNNSSELSQNVLDHFAVADKMGFRTIRNDIVHGCWWLVPVGPDELLWSGRYYAGGKQPPGSVHGSPEQLYSVADKLFHFAAELESFVTPYWPMAIVPTPDSFPNDPDAVVDLTARIHSVAPLNDDGAPSTRQSSAASKPKPGQKPAGRTPRKRSKH